MAFPSRLLNEGEHVVVSTRTHVKALLLPALLLILLAGVAGFLVSIVPASGAQTLVQLVIWGWRSSSRCGGWSSRSWPG